MSGLFLTQERALKLGHLPTLMQSQRGNDCKLIAIGTVLAWLHTKGSIQQKPFRPRFRHQKNKQQKPSTYAFFSLRQIAKHKLAAKQSDSDMPDAKSIKQQITEAIDDPEILAQVARQHPEVAADYAHCETEEHYLQLLKQAIDNNLAPIVFFDVSPGTWQPGSFNGAQEHAAVVVGYKQVSGTIHFTVAHWGKTTLVEGRAMFRSSQQLRSEQPAEFYYKYTDRKDENGKGWVPEAQIRQFKFLQECFPKFPDLSSYPSRQNPATSAASNHGGLRGKILLIDSKQRYHLMRDLKAQDPLGPAVVQSSPVISSPMMSPVPMDSPTMHSQSSGRSKKPAKSPSPTQAFSSRKVIASEKAKPLTYWLWRALVLVASLASLYTIGHSLSVLILQAPVLGMSIANAPWILCAAFILLFVILTMTKLNTKHPPLPKAILSKSAPTSPSSLLPQPKSGYQLLATQPVTSPKIRATPTASCI